LDVCFVQKPGRSLEVDEVGCVPDRRMAVVDRRAADREIRRIERGPNPELEEREAAEGEGAHRQAAFLSSGFGSTSSARSGAWLSRQSWQRSEAASTSEGAIRLPQARQVESRLRITRRPPAPPGGMGKRMPERVESFRPVVHDELEGGARALVVDGDGEVVRRLIPEQDHVEAVVRSGVRAL
jgi:hypothetical protein